MLCQNTRGTEREVCRGDLAKSKAWAVVGFISAGRLSPRLDLKLKMRTPCERGMDHDLCAVLCLSSSSRILAWSVSTRGREDCWSPRDIAIPQGQGSADEWYSTASRWPRREKGKKENKACEEARGRLGDACRLWSETWRIRRGEKGVGARNMVQMD